VVGRLKGLCEKRKLTDGEGREDREGGGRVWKHSGRGVQEKARRKKILRSGSSGWIIAGKKVSCIGMEERNEIQGGGGGWTSAS